MDFPSNTNKDKETSEPTPEPKKKIEKIVEGEVIKRKKPWNRRMTELFIGGDIKSVGSYVVRDVMVPGTKDIIYDVLSSGVERILFGEGIRGGGSRRGRVAGQLGRVAYDRFSSGMQSQTLRNRDEPRQLSRRARAFHEFDEIILASRQEAQEVLDRMFIEIEKYGLCKVSDLYEMVGVTGSFTDEKWGWTDISGAGITRVKGAYLLDLPQPDPIRD